MNKKKKTFKNKFKNLMTFCIYQLPTKYKLCKIQFSEILFSLIFSYAFNEKVEKSTN